MSLRTALPAALISLAATALSVAPATTARADTFAPVTDQREFVQLVAGRELTRFGIRLQVSPQGEIEGRAFGRKVSGAWQWNGNYFCRELFYGEDDLGGPNCQVVLRNGDTLRFVADQGQGMHADLRLR